MTTSPPAHTTSRPSAATLTELRTLFFGSHSQQCQALALYHAHRLHRTPLPRGVESTAYLVDALLNASPSAAQRPSSPPASRSATPPTSHSSDEGDDEPPPPKRRRTSGPMDTVHGSTPFSSHLALSAAFTHFVTAHCDQPKHAPKRTMTDVARDQEMPVEFVTWRHEIAHRGRASAGRVRMFCQRAVEWLRVSFWEEFNPDRGPDGSEGDVLDDLTAEKLEQALSSFRKERLKEMREQGLLQLEGVSNAVREGLMAVTKAALESGRDVVARALSEDTFAITKASLRASFAPDRDAVARALSEKLVREKYMIPAASSGGSMTGAFNLWDQLLQLLAPSFPSLIKELLRLLVHGVVHEAEMGKNHAEACEAWIDHMLEDALWSALDVPDAERMRELVQELLESRPFKSARAVRAWSNVRHRDEESDEDTESDMEELESLESHSEAGEQEEVQVKTGAQET